MKWVINYHSHFKCEETEMQGSGITFPRLQELWSQDWSRAGWPQGCVRPCSSRLPADPETLVLVPTGPMVWLLVHLSLSLHGPPREQS